jgi:hypothetical protein
VDAPRLTVRACPAAEKRLLVQREAEAAKQAVKQASQRPTLVLEGLDEGEKAPSVGSGAVLVVGEKAPSVGSGAVLLVGEKAPSVGSGAVLVVGEKAPSVGSVASVASVVLAGELTAPSVTSVAMLHYTHDTIYVWHMRYRVSRLQV